MRIQRVIVLMNGAQLIGVFSNLARVYDRVIKNTKQGYATVARTLEYQRKYDFGSGVFEGTLYENLTIRRVIVNDVATQIRG